MTRKTNPCPKTPSACANIDAWNFSTATTRQAFWKMVEKGEEADIFDAVFSELTIDQCKNINKHIDAEIWKELFLEKENP